jgi:hypothetical protein
MKYSSNAHILLLAFSKVVFGLRERNRKERKILKTMNEFG